jgi:hypothetical protein
MNRVVFAVLFILMTLAGQALPDSGQATPDSTAPGSPAGQETRSGGSGDKTSGDKPDKPADEEPECD